MYKACTYTSGYTGYISSYRGFTNGYNSYDSGYRGVQDIIPVYASSYIIYASDYTSYEVTTVVQRADILNMSAIRGIQAINTCVASGYIGYTSGYLGYTRDYSGPLNIDLTSILSTLITII